MFGVSCLVIGEINLNGSSSRQQIQGVFKILKPGIRRHLEEELIILEKTAAFFEENRQRYNFKDFRFLDIFREVREIMIKDLAINDFMGNDQQRQAFRSVVLNHLRSSEFVDLSLIKKSFKLLEQLSFEGFVFPADLMLFRKAIFTLEGVLYDLDPSFDMNAAIMQYMTALMTGELPRRFSNLFFPLADKSENYASLISNIELQSLMVHLSVDAMKSGYELFGRYFTTWSRMFGASSE